MNPIQNAGDDLTCDSCPVFKRCPWAGSSPMRFPDVDGEIRCMPIAYGRTSLGVMIPSGVQIDPQTGVVCGINAQLHWVRYRGRFRAWLRRLFTGGRRV